MSTQIDDYIKAVAVIKNIDANVVLPNNIIPNLMATKLHGIQPMQQNVGKVFTIKYRTLSKRELKNIMVVTNYDYKSRFTPYFTNTNDIDEYDPLYCFMVGDNRTVYVAVDSDGLFYMQLETTQQIERMYLLKNELDGGVYRIEDLENKETVENILELLLIKSVGVAVESVFSEIRDYIEKQKK